MKMMQLQFGYRKPSAKRGGLARRLSALAMSLLLVCSLPLSAFADTWYLENGDITVNATESGQTVSQGETSKNDDAPVITQSNSSTPNTNTVTIKAEENATANVTLSGVNIDTSGAAVEIKGNGDVVIELDGTNTVQSGFNHAGVEKNTIAPTDNDPGSGNGNLTITDGNETNGSLKATGGENGSGIGGGSMGSGSNITITGSAEVIAQGGPWGSGIGGGNGGSGSEITISGGTVEAKGGENGSGIGGGDFGAGSNITISGGTVEAKGGENGSGIGGGNNGSGSEIIISGSAEVTAIGGDFGAGIGGGSWTGSSSNITISGDAKVTSKGGITGAGIGGGLKSDSTNITVSENAQVKAQGGVSVVGNNSVIGEGAAIGNGGDYQYGTTDAEPYKGQEVAPITKALDEGWIATYVPDTENMNTATPNSLTYEDASGKVQTATENITIEAAESATSNTHGHEAGFKVDNTELVAVTTHNYGNYVSNNDATCTKNGTENGKCSVPGCSAEHTRTVSNSKLPHEYGDYVPDADNRATCATDGTKTATCENCTATDTVTDPAKGHSFTNYVSNNDATYAKDGTKTAKCDHPGCDATDTITDPGTRLPAPLYQLKGQDGMAVGGKTEQKDGVLTIEVDADFASLTGYLWGIQALQVQGVDTIVFVTNGATSTFALADLLASMTAGDSYALTHDGKTVTFTLATGTDISGILK